MAANFRDQKGLGWNFATTVLMYADLHGVTLDGRTLRGLDLTEADLTDADFSRSVFEECKLSHASWTNARFESADLRGADLGPLESLEQLAALKGAVLNDRQAKAIVNALGITVISSDDEPESGLAGRFARFDELGQLGTRRVLPQPLEVVIAAHLVAEHVDDEVAVVQQDPAALRAPFAPDRLALLRGQDALDLFGDRLHLALRGAEQIRK